MSASDETLAALPGLPRDGDGPVFAAPWQAQAFAMAVRLNERGVFTLPEWAERLGAAMREQEAGGRTAPDGTQEAYYLAWIAALETLLAEKGVVAEAERAARVAAWDRAARATPHGEPIVLGRETDAHPG